CPRALPVAIEAPVDRFVAAIEAQELAELPIVEAAVRVDRMIHRRDLHERRDLLDPEVPEGREGREGRADGVRMARVGHPADRAPEHLSPDLAPRFPGAATPPEGET